MNEIDYNRIRGASLQGPRLTSLFQKFEDIALGLQQVPKGDVHADPSFLKCSNKFYEYHNIFQKNIGTFYRHLCASIPFLLEEHCRLGVALSQLAHIQNRDKKQPFTLYETSSADGTNARTLAQYSKGIIKSLTDTPNPANGRIFRKLCQHNYSDIHIGPWVDITPEYLAGRSDRSYFMQGFDAIYENTTFQMYGPSRKEQIAYVRRVLKSEGLIIFCEKMNNPNRSEYERREQIKDSLFKSRYFTIDEIEIKKSQILEQMEHGQVTLDEFVEAASNHFKFICMIWNSTNFYEIIASNSKATFDTFLSLLAEPYVPASFACDTPMVRWLSI
jgi:tRNA (cmo5U34)-methyltransferase